MSKRNRRNRNKPKLTDHERRLLTGHRLNCSKHKAYKTLSEARKARSNQMSSHNFTGGQLGIYQCKCCGMFHVGRISVRDMVQRETNETEETEDI